MIITENIRLTRMLYFTWKTDVFLLACCIVSYIANQYLIASYFMLPTFVPTLLGTALAFFIGFNNNQAYDRWWEARKIWGALVNESRTWARNLLSYSTTEKSDDETLNYIQRTMILRHLAFLHALRFSLRGSTDDTYKKYLTVSDIKKVENKNNIHNAILSLQSQDLQYMYEKGYINDFRFIQLNQNITEFQSRYRIAARRREKHLLLRYPIPMPQAYRCYTRNR
jgi:putative membrane protein